MRDEILARFQRRAYVWSATPSVQAELTAQVRQFVSQLEILLTLGDDERETEPCCEQISSGATTHARSLQRHGFPLAQAVNDYGDVCRVISEVASEQQQPISGPELQKLSLGSVLAILAVAKEYGHAQGGDASSVS